MLSRIFILPFVAFVSVVVLTLAGCTKSAPIPGQAPLESLKTSIPGVTPANTFNAAFTQFGPGWTGADQCISIPLPDGSTIWIFGDSFIGTVAPDRSRPPGSSTFVRNSAVVSRGSSLQTLVRNDGGVASAWLVPPEADAWYWPQDGFVFDGNLYLVCLTLRNDGSGGIFGFETFRSDLVRVDLNSMEQTGRMAYPAAGMLYGAEVLDHDGFWYIYGIKERAAGKQMVISRIPSSVEPGTVPPTYWDGSSWSSNAADVLPMLDDLSTIFSVFPNPSGSGYVLISQEDFFSDKIFRWTGPSPVGPFTDKTLLFRTPQDGGNIWTYNAIAHPEFLHPDGSVLVSWSCNSVNFADLFTDADNYRPWFAWVAL